MSDTKQNEKLRNARVTFLFTGNDDSRSFNAIGDMNTINLILDDIKQSKWSMRLHGFLESVIIANKKKEENNFKKASPVATENAPIWWYNVIAKTFHIIKYFDEQAKNFFLDYEKNKEIYKFIPLFFAAYYLRNVKGCVVYSTSYRGGYKDKDATEGQVKEAIEKHPNCKFGIYVVQEYLTRDGGKRYRTLHIDDEFKFSTYNASEKYNVHAKIPIQKHWTYLDRFKVSMFLLKATAGQIDLSRLPARTLDGVKMVMSDNGWCSIYKKKTLGG